MASAVHLPPFSSHTAYFTRSWVGALPSASNPFQDVTRNVVLKTLRKDTSPDGYAPLDPTYRDFVHLPSSSMLSSASSLLSFSSSIFAGTDVVIVADDREELALNEIRETEALSFSILYEAIKNGKTNIKISADNPVFKEEILEYIRTLALRPSGRLLLAAITSLPREVVIYPGETCAVKPVEKGRPCEIEWNLDLRDFMICRSAEGIVIEDSPLFLGFAHELIHVIHDDWDPREVLKTKKSKATGDYSDLEEQFTIAGCSSLSFLCENTLRCEFGFLPRASHKASSFPPFTSADAATINTDIVDGHNRLQNAAALGLLSEIKKLLPHGANPTHGLYFALLNNHADVLDYLLANGANPNYRDALGCPKLHDTVALKKPSCLSVFLKHKADINAVDPLGRTPLRLAVDRSFTVGAEILLKYHADVDKPAHDGLSPLAQAIIKGNWIMVRLLLNHDATLDRGSRAALRVLRKLRHKPMGKKAQSAIRNAYLRISRLVSDHVLKQKKFKLLEDKL